MQKLVLLSLIFGIAASCNYDPGFGDLTCETEGETDAMGRICRDGYWVSSGEMNPDMHLDLDQEFDVPEPDMPDPPDMSDMECVPETDEELCEGMQSDCGSVNSVDRCGTARVLECGECEEPETCGAVTPNQCGCVPQSRLQFCLSYSKSCDDFTEADNCGQMRTEDCGTCQLPAVCGGGGTPNTCACPDQTDAEFCAVNNANCGPVENTDECGQLRLVSCGMCNGTGESCGGGGTPSMCGCTPELDAEFCTRLGKNCGSVTDNDNCGQPRTVNCGSCTMPEGCGDGGEDNVCGCGTDASVCQFMNKDCDTVDSSTLCSNKATVNCGMCSGPGVSCGGGTPSEANVCGCTPEDRDEFCDRYGKDCGSFSEEDNCGTQRNNVNCGTCMGFETCGEGSPGVANVCGCDPETDLEFCDRNDVECGMFSGTDNCGAPRNNINCPNTCSGPETCAGSTPPIANTCGCTPDSDAQFCAANGKDCGLFSGTDNCNLPRTNVNCGATCDGPGESCAGGSPPVSNVCGCTPQSDEDFCDKNNAKCGSFTGMDNCEVSRTVSCPNLCELPETCGGGTSGPNSCGCTPPTDEEFCADNGKNCGDFTGVDSCGLPRTNIDCGDCSGSETCGGGDPGEPNVCGCDPEDDATFCSNNNVECGTFTGVDNCGDTRTDVPCPDTCTAPETCGGGDPSVANECGCTPQTDEELCVQENQDCGVLADIEDNCGVMRTGIVCNACSAPLACGSADECVCLTCAPSSPTCGNGAACDLGGGNTGTCNAMTCQ